MSSDIKKIINQAQFEIRNEKLSLIFKKNKKILSLILGLSIACSIGYTAFKIDQKSKQQKYSEMLHQSMIDQQLGDIEKTKQTLKTIHESSTAPSGVKSLASIRYAGILLDEGNKEEAIKVYKEVNDCNFCDNYIKELSGLLMVRTIMTDDNLVGDENLADKILKIENNSKILRYYIAEQRGYLEMNKNNLAKAYEIFEMISKNPDVKENLKNRASDAMKIVIQKGYEPKTS
ncbi:MAG: hypothetical protein EBT63_04900 [Proteobacteria bacterium]|nr:hypothetical protein [Pseudomonadota bacterium]NCA28437.1 hypothetical protein [Pseudomonadota bacterium]